MSDCLFCKIINGQIPSKKVFENDHVYAFEDINKEAPVHVLFVPKKHIESLDMLENEDLNLIAEVHKAIRDYAKEAGFNQEGYRVVNNTNKGAGQTVFHIHFHLLAGRNLQWPPG